VWEFLCFAYWQRDSKVAQQMADQPRFTDRCKRFAVFNGAPLPADRRARDEVVTAYLKYALRR
jgi:hypothetical protein